MSRAFALLALAALGTPVVAADPAPLAFSPPGAKLPAAAKFRVGRPTGHMTGVLAFSADGKTLATFTNLGYTGGIEAPVDLWNVETGAHVATLRYHHTGVMAAAFSPDGSVIATSGIDDRLRFWDAKTGKDITVPEHIALSGHGYNLCFSPDGKRLLVGSSRLEMYDVATQQPLKGKIGYFATTEKSNFFHTATWSPKGTYIAAGCDGGGVRVWDADGKLLYKLTDKYTAHRTVFAFSSDDKQVLLATWPDGLFSVHDAGTGKEQTAVKTPANEKPSEQVQFARAGRVAWVVTTAQQPYAGTRLAVADATGQELKRFDVPAGVIRHMLSHDGKRLAVGGLDGSLRIYETDTGKLEQTMLGAWSPVFRTVYADGGKVLRTIHTRGTVHDFDADTGKHLKERTLKLGTSKYLVAVSADGGLLASATEDGTCTVWDLATGAERAKPKGKLHGHRDLVFGAPLLPPDLPPPPAPNDAPECGFPPPPPPMTPGPPQYFAAFSPDGKLFAAVTGEDEAVTVWDSATGEEKHALKVPKGIGALAFSADGAHLFAGHGRNMVLRVAELDPGKEPDTSAFLRRYELKTGKEVQGWKALPGEKRPNLAFAGVEVVGLRLSADGTTLLVTEELVYTPVPARPPNRFGGAAPASRFSRVRVVNLAGREKDRTIDTGPGGALPSVSPDGKTLGFVLHNETDNAKPSTAVKVIEIATEKARTLTVPGHLGSGDTSRAVVFRPGGTDLAVSADGTVLVIDGTKLKDGK